MITITKARQLRKMIERLAEALSDSEALENEELFPVWRLKEYVTGERVRYGETLYKCLQNHTAQSDWTPDTAVSLWVRVDDPSVEWPEWAQPQGAADAYPLGAKVSHLEKHWVSEYDNNVWEPSVFGWQEEN